MMSNYDNMMKQLFHGSIFHLVLKIVNNLITFVNNYGTIVDNFVMIANNAHCKSRQKWGRKWGTGKSG